MIGWAQMIQRTWMCKPAAYSQWHHVYICLPTALIPVSISVLRELVVYIPSSLSYIPEYTHPSNTSFSSRILVSVSCLVKPDRFSTIVLRCVQKYPCICIVLCFLICITVPIYVLVLVPCIYFSCAPVLNTALYKYYSLVVSYIHPCC